MNIKPTAREILTFITYFPLMVGDLIAPNGSVWKSVINLLRLHYTFWIFIKRTKNIKRSYRIS